MVAPKSTPTEMEVTKDEASPMVEKNDTNQGATHGDVQSLIEKEVLKVDAVKEVANNEETLDSPKCWNNFVTITYSFIIAREKF